jgi:hypothetical protein
MKQRCVSRLIVKAKLFYFSYKSYLNRLQYILILSDNTSLGPSLHPRLQQGPRIAQRVNDTTALYVYGTKIVGYVEFRFES